MECVQYIVVRKDLDMPVGKLCSQVAHASLGVMLERKQFYVFSNPKDISLNSPDMKIRNVTLIDTKESRSWFEGRFVKLVVYVKSEQKLLNLSKKLDDLGITNKLIYDAGRTIFNGETTLTCMGIEPIYRDNVPKCLKVLRLLD
jgi:PTH2 family peptidyl-tRNA hydrolase